MKKINMYDYETEVLNIDTPVLVKFFGSWCQPCQMLKPVIDKIADDYADSVDVFEVDVAVQKALSAKLGILSVPTVIMLKNGKEVKRQMGYKSYEFYQEWLDE